MNKSTYPSLWNLPANPVFRRHAIALLRPWRVAIWLLVMQLIAGFFWAVTALGYLHSQVNDPAAFELFSPAFKAMLEKHGTNACLLAWMVLLGIQGLLVVLKGTFSVATGVAREAHEGMIESETLAPLPTGHKVIGQLLGLPILENLIAASLLIWAGLSAWIGDLPLAMMGKVYLLFATTAVFHHSIGLVAGSLIRQKILAGTISQMLIIVIHFILPALGGFGIGLISHLGAEPAIQHEIVTAMPELVRTGGLMDPESVPKPVEFFNWEMAISGYHWLITLSALATLLIVMARRWNDRSSQLLGKVGTSLLAVWLLLLTCGELVPRFLRGEGLTHVKRITTLEIGTFVVMAESLPQAATLWAAGLAMVLGWLNLTLTSTLVPSPEALARRRHLLSTPWWSDGSNALPWVATISLITAATWSWAVHVLLRETPAFHAMHIGPAEILSTALALMVPACAVHALVLWRGWKSTLAIGFVVWLGPLMASCVGLLLSADPLGWPKWLSGASGLLLPAYAVLGEMPGLSKLNCQPVFISSLLLHAVFAAFCLHGPRIPLNPKRS